MSGDPRQAVRDALVRSQRPDGGWGAEPRRRSNTEATALAVLALEGIEKPAAARSREGGVGWLAARQGPDGSWPLTAGEDARPWATPLAALALLGQPAHQAATGRALRWLVGQSGREVGWIISLLYRFYPGALPVRMDPHLRGWSWTPDALSWVEPTAYALLALKRGGALAGDAAADRIREGERMLYDRMCEGGGWNYGNSNVHGVAVPPYPEVTAVALIALQDRAGEAATRQSLEALPRMVGKTDSGFTLAWASLCLALYGRETADMRRALASAWERTGFLGATRTLALASLALDGRADAFRVRAAA